MNRIMSVPLDAIDPEARTRTWEREFEWHLDQLPIVLEAIITTTLPGLRAGRIEKRITGGGFIDNMTSVLAAFDQSSNADGITPSAAVDDADTLWTWLVQYTAAVDEWILTTPDNAAPTLPVKVDADPLTARRLAQSAIAWLIDHANQIRPVTELDEHMQAMFGTIRRLRSRYGVVPRTRVPRAVCSTCGDRAVTVVWVDAVNGSPKPEQVGKCRRCGEVFRQANGGSAG